MNLENAIETKDLWLAKPTFEDWKSMYHNLWKHEESAKYMLWKTTKSEEAAKERIQRSIKFHDEHKDVHFIFEKKSGEAIGFVGMIEIAAGVYEDTGIAIGPKFVRKGYGKQVLNAIVDVARGYGAKEFVCSCRSANIASAKLQQSCGFIYDHSEDRVDPRNGLKYQLDFYKLKL